MFSGKKLALKIRPTDNVATVLDDVVKGDIVHVRSADSSEDRMLEARENVPFGFKVSLSDIQKGEHIIKYGEIIGKASDFIGEGCLVHVHNVEGLRGRGDLEKTG